MKNLVDYFKLLLLCIVYSLPITLILLSFKYDSKILCGIALFLTLLFIAFSGEEQDYL